MLRGRARRLPFPTACSELTMAAGRASRRASSATPLSITPSPAGRPRHKPIRNADAKAAAGSHKAPGAAALGVQQSVLDLLRSWSPVLVAGRVGTDRAERAARRAVAHGSDFARELVLTGAIEETILFRLIADHLGLDFQARVEPGSLVTQEWQERILLRVGLSAAPVRMLREDDRAAIVIASYGLDLAAWRRRLGRSPALLARLVVVAPAELRRALVARSRDWLLRDAVHHLFLSQPTDSAHDVVTPWQGWLAGVLAVLLPLALIAAPKTTIVCLSAFATIAFFACVSLRLLALSSARPLRRPSPFNSDPSTMPVYSVLVALHREKDVVSQLLVGLGKLQWPRSRLEIKLVCEADDAETLAALDAHQLHPCIEIVHVPAALPRTKPKALAYALPLCAGEFVTLYDAEDRPHPAQLLEAWQRFAKSDETLACLQAPLVITNGRAGWLSGMFAFEYAGLFRGLLPWLASRGAVVPLGGTSNHFRRSALVEVGGWDPYNVTEDADLGIRLRRRGYRVGTLSLPTLEDGPETLSDWLPQRTRWFKGWIQTWLVHMRQPSRLAGDLGPVSFAVAQVLMAGMVVSALMHPLFLGNVIFVSAKLAITGDMNGSDALLALFGIANIVSGYGAFILIGHATLAEGERQGIGWTIARTPLHWILLSVAAWRSIYELLRAPHRWNKTTHKPAARRSIKPAFRPAPSTERR
jgi:cellulose synthase/poly-beta-1,6-N-acetylglucosamine synthase-like glycosyltransferase